MFKGVKVFVASLFAMLLCAAPASAISFSSLEQISEPTDNIEVNTPEDDYAFDTNFLAKNQELKYKTTLTNDESLPIKIESIDLNTSSYNFLEYSYDGISADDTIETGATRDLIISVRTNSNDTSTVSEDYNLTINYSQVQPEPDPDPDPIPDPDPTPDPDEPDADKPENPETATTAVVKTGAIALISIGAIVFVFARNKKIRNCVVLFVATSLGICLLASTATAEGDTSTYTIRGKVRFTNIYTVTVDPNEGTYAGDLQVTRREGESYHIENITREHFNFVEWEINPSNTPDENNNIEIHANTTLKAKWNEKTYTLTINPNGGKYLDSESVWNQSYRPGQSASISAPTKEGYEFKYWTVEEGSIGQDGRFNGNSVTMNENITLVAYYEIQTYTVTIVPNGGSYTGSLTTTVDWNTDYEIQSISRDGYDLKNWTKANSDGTTTLSADTQTVNIKSNTTLTANWWSSTFYTVTIDPNGGSYAGDLETQVRAGETYTMQTVAKENYVLNYWHYTGTDTHMDDESFVVNSNISLTAEWTFPVARIESTQKLYPSIMAAHEEAESGDTITLLVNDAEIVTNSKNITLDLNQHTVYGYLNNTRSGNITLLNGEINNYDTPAEGTYYQTGSAADYSAPIIDSVNPSGAAVINAGTLTMGIDDYEDAAMNEKVPLINNQYVRLIGSSIGLDQNGHFYFYDGFIEGTIGLKGGYDGSPWYRETFDGTVVNYFPFVTKNTTKNCQHVELSNADKAVSKTIDNGPIYYYNLQDNINTSTLTGYQIYAVRNFDGSYAITVDDGADITFDITGFTVNLGEDVTVDGELTILDSATTKGLLTSSKTIQNNGELVIRNMTLSAITTNTLLQNNNSLSLQNATITSDKGTTLYLPNQEVTLSLDNNSYIITESNQPALINDSPSTTINAGTITGTACTVLNNSGKTFTLNAGTITGQASAVCNYGGTFTMNDGLVSTEYNSETKAIYTPWGYSGSEININGGKVSVKHTGTVEYEDVYGIYTYTNNDVINITGGEIEVTSSPTLWGSRIYGIYTYAPVNITGGHIKVNGKSPNGTIGIYSGDKGNLTINGADVVIEVNSEEGTGTTYGVLKYGNTAYLKQGSITVNAKNSNAIAVHNQGSTVRIEDGMSLSSHSNTQNAYGIWCDSRYDYDHGTTVMTGGSISATTDASGKIGVGIVNRTATITGGTVYGSSYGISGAMENSTATITLGVNEPPLYNGVDEDGGGNVYPATPEIRGGVYGINNGNVYFYDGILKGGSTYVNNENIIKAIPDGTSRVVTNLSDPVEQDCWLEYDEDYLQLGSNGQTYNSLTAIYADAQETDTITVIRDASTPAVLPSNTKNITFDLNGHIVNYSQPFRNNGTMVITDSSNEKSGALNNNSWATDRFIENNGTLTISAGTITGTACTVLNNSGKTFTLNAGTITGQASAVCNYGGTFTMNDGLVSTEYNSETKAIYTPWGYSGSEININGGKVSVKHTGTVEYEDVYGIYTYTNNDVINITGGEIEVTSSPTLWGSRIYGIYTYAPVNITGGHIKVNGKSPNGTIGIYSGDKGNLTINGADVVIEVNSEEGTGTTYGVLKYGNTAYLKQGSITVNAKNSNAIAVHNQGSTVRIEDGMSLSSHSNTQNAYGIWCDSRYDYDHGTTVMTGGSISATTDASGKIGVGIVNRTATITGGTVYGSSYGISGAMENSTATITLGVNEPPLYNGVDEDGGGNVYPATPEIRGGVYGINNGNVYFYDGILKGGSLAYFDRNIKAIANNTYIHGSTETIDGKEYQVRYLANKEVLAKIGNTEYYSLQAAADAANDGDEIDLVADNYIFERLNFPANKTISVDFNGFEVVTGNQVINNGNVTLFDSSNGAKLLRYAEANWFITNEANASLTINDIDIQSRFAIYNKANGTVTLKNLAIGKNSYSETAIENYGNLNLDNVEIHALNRVILTTDGSFDIKSSNLYIHPYNNNTTLYAIENNNSTGTMTDSTISVMTDLISSNSGYMQYKYAYYQTGDNADLDANQTTFKGYTRIVKGNFTLTRGALTHPENRMHHNYTLLYNSGATIIDNSSVLLEQDNTYSVYDYSWSSVITNAGTLTVKNNTTVKHVLVNDANRAISRIINNTGTLTIENARINQEYMNVPSNIGTGMGDTYGIYSTGTVNYTNSTIDLGHRNTYGIYAESGNVNVYSGTVKVGGSNNAFALWAKSGAITLGEAEPTDSPNYGTANANVSTTSPNITAIGDNLGIGVTLENGSFNFYDGKITQNSTVGPAVQADHVTRATVTNVEYLYQPETYTDTSGHTYFILEFMR